MMEAAHILDRMHEQRLILPKSSYKSVEKFHNFGFLCNQYIWLKLGNDASKMGEKICTILTYMPDIFIINILVVQMMAILSLMKRILSMHGFSQSERSQNG